MDEEIKNHMNKPQIQIKEYYDWNEVKAYIEAKYKLELRDMAGKFTKENNINAPYQDFWHSLLDRYEIHNGCFVNFFYENEPFENSFEHEWEKKIARILQEEFYVEGKEIEFYVWW